MITSDRDQFVGVHLRFVIKDALRAEADRRKISLSLLLSNIAEEWLEKGTQEVVEPKRSNKRVQKDLPNEIDVPLPLEGD